MRGAFLMLEALRKTGLRNCLALLAAGLAPAHSALGAMQTIKLRLLPAGGARAVWRRGRQAGGGAGGRPAQPPRAARGRPCFG